MKNLTLIILFAVAMFLVVVGAFVKIITKGSSVGNEIMIAAICMKTVIIVVFIWKYRNAIIPWLKQ